MNSSGKPDFKFTLLTNGYFWQWNNLSKPYVKKDFQADGSFQYGHMLIDNSTGKITNFYKEDLPREEQMNESFSDTYKEDLNGQYVIPGLQDSHLHVSINAMQRSFAILFGSKSINEVLQRLEKHRKDNPTQNWIIGAGWNQLEFDEDFEVFPTRYDLDKIFPDIPVFILRRCMHIVVCNTMAFYKSNLDPYHPENWDIPEKQREQIYFKDGEPTGIIVEDATDIFFRTMLAENNRVKDCVCNEFKFLASNGLVGAQTNDYSMDIIYNELQEENNLAVRVFHTVFFDEFVTWLNKLYIKAYPSSGSPTLEQLVNFTQNIDRDTINILKKYGPYLKSPTTNSLVSCERIKIFTDGTLGGKTAALSVPYLTDANESDQTPNYGIFRETELSIYQKIKIIKNCGLRVEVHAIGDHASERTIDAMIAGGMTDTQDRPVLNHCQLLRKELIEKMFENHIIGNIQPSFVPSDIESLEQFIPSFLHDYSYAWKTMSSNGIVCSGGSDAPVEHLNPMLALFDAMYRPYKHFTSQSKLMADAYINQLNGILDLKTQPLELIEVPDCPPESFNPKECLTFPEALRLYTINGAYAARCDFESNPNMQIGKLENGFMADFTVLDRDISSQSYRTLIEANVMQTWVNGKQVFNLNQTEAYQYKSRSIETDTKCA